MMILTKGLQEIANALADEAEELTLMGKEETAMAMGLAASILVGFLRLPSSKMTEIHLLGLGVPAGIVQALVSDVELHETPKMIGGLRVCQN
jgi:hypothetical protein